MRKIIAHLVIIFVVLKASGAFDFSSDKRFLVTGCVVFGTAYFIMTKMIPYFYLMLLGIFTVISAVYFLKNGAFDAVTFLGFFLKIQLAFFCREICQEHFPKYFVNIVFVWTCITLPLFAFQLINFDLLYKLNSTFIEVSTGNEPISSSLFFAMVPIHETRNSGFMWEPGAFAAVLVITVYINTFHVGESLFSRRNGILIAAILTTQSTMGFLSLLIPIGLVMREAIVEHKAMRQISVFLVPLLFVIFGFLFTKLDFLAAKIIDQFVNIDDEIEFVEQGNRDGFVVATTRITSVVLDWQTIKNYPILGLGIDMRTTGLDKLVKGDMTVTACGLTNMLLRFGFLGMGLYAFLWYKNAFFEQKIHRIGWVCLLFTILCSNEFTASAFLHLFIF